MDARRGESVAEAAEGLCRAVKVANNWCLRGCYSAIGVKCGHGLKCVVSGYDRFLLVRVCLCRPSGASGVRRSVGLGLSLMARESTCMAAPCLAPPAGSTAATAGGPRRAVRSICQRAYLCAVPSCHRYVPEGVAPLLLREGCDRRHIFEMTWGEERDVSCWTEERGGGITSCLDGDWRKPPALEVPKSRRRRGFPWRRGAEKEEDKDTHANKPEANKTSSPVKKFKIVFTPGVHWSGRSVRAADYNRSLWGGYVIHGPHHRFYYAGDTSYWREDFDEFRKIGKLYGPFDLAAIPIGAYEPNADLKWQHINPAEAVKVARDVRAEVAVAMHWGTFRLSSEEFFQPLWEINCALLGISESHCRSFFLTGVTDEVRLSRKGPVLKKTAAPGGGAAPENFNQTKSRYQSFYASQKNKPANMTADEWDLDAGFTHHSWENPSVYPSMHERLETAIELFNKNIIERPGWKARLFTHSVRFQVLHIGHSIQVSSPSQRFLDGVVRMTRTCDRVNYACRYRDEIYRLPKLFVDRVGSRAPAAPSASVGVAIEPQGVTPRPPRQQPLGQVRSRSAGPPDKWISCSIGDAPKRFSAVLPISSSVLSEATRLALATGKFERNEPSQEEQPWKPPAPKSRTREEGQSSAAAVATEGTTAQTSVAAMPNVRRKRAGAPPDRAEGSKRQARKGGGRTAMAPKTVTAINAKTRDSHKAKKNHREAPSDDLSMFE
eukprot:GHVT01009458.1.p1 GENE.GHVT01009458.1~~GHVT01009458.1.p1  ORF type:complete len:720 (+),score=104.02 GHVT01009458.1:3912-6071(+)